MKVCPKCGKVVNDYSVICSSCGHIFVNIDKEELLYNIKNSEVSGKINEYINAENFDKVKEGVGNIAEQVANQAQKEGTYIKNRRENNENISEDEFIISKMVLDGIEYLSSKKQERDEDRKAQNAERKKQKEEDKVKRGEEKVKKEAENRPENALFYIDGREGTLAIFDEYIQLDFTGSALKQYLSRMGGVKKIYYPQINSIQKRDVGEFITGSIEFEVPGMSYSGRGGGKSENIIHYEYYYQEEADKIYEFVNQKILNIQRNSTNPQPNSSEESSVLSELKKAKELLDMGAITQEEFDNIKNDLLNH